MYKHRVNQHRRNQRLVKMTSLKPESKVPRWKKNVAVATVCVMVMLIASIIGLSPASASEPTSNPIVVIRTHEDMTISNQIFMSQAAKCSLPSRSKLAKMTNSPIANWGQPGFGNREIDYYGDGETVISIGIQKDQVLFTGNRAKLKYHTYGDVYVGRGDFTFKCYNSRHRLFNPNVRSICGPNGGVEMLERVSDRNWFTAYEGDPGLPTAEYQYRRLARLPRFFVPGDAEFYVNDVREGITKTLTAGYYTSVIPRREKYFDPWIVVDAFC